MQKRRNSIVLTVKLLLFCIKPLMLFSKISVAIIFNSAPMLHWMIVIFAPQIHFSILDLRFIMPLNNTNWRLSYNMVQLHRS